MCGAATKSEYCIKCLKSKTGYFEGTLQLRNRKNPHYQEAVGLVDKSKGAIAKVIRHKEGEDFYLSTNKAVLNTARIIHRRFGGSILLTRKLHHTDHSTSKHMYRVTALVRLPDFGVGDVILVKGKLLYVNRTSGGTITCTELKSFKQTKLPYTQPDRIYNSDEAKTVQISRTQPRLEVLSPIDYQSTTVENPRKVKGEQVKIMDIEGKLFLVPQPALE